MNTVRECDVFHLNNFSFCFTLLIFRLLDMFMYYNCHRILLTFVLFEVNTLLFLLSLAEHKKKEDILKNIRVQTTLLADCSGYFTENISESFNCHFEAKQSCCQFCSE